MEGGLVKEPEMGLGKGWAQVEDQAQAEKFELGLGRCWSPVEAPSMGNGLRAVVGPGWEPGLSWGPQFRTRIRAWLRAWLCVQHRDWFYIQLVAFRKAAAEEHVCNFRPFLNNSFFIFQSIDKNIEGGHLDRYPSRDALLHSYVGYSQLEAPLDLLHSRLDRNRVLGIEFKWFIHSWLLRFFKILAHYWMTFVQAAIFGWIHFTP